MAELFTQQRMQRCADIALKIVVNWQRTNSFAYTVRATESVEGISLAELRKRYFSVGIGDDLVDLPLDDVVAVFSIVEKHSAAMKSRGTTPGQLSISLQAPSDFSDEEAARILSQLQIEAPFDTGKWLRVSPVRRPAAGDDDRQAPP